MHKNSTAFTLLRRVFLGAALASVLMPPVPALAEEPPAEQSAAEAEAPLTPSALWGSLVPGAHKVGFQIFNRRDKGRPDPSGSEEGRPLQIGLWYPTEASDPQSQMTFRDYFALSTREKEFGPRREDEEQAAIAEFQAQLAKSDVEGPAVEALLNTTMYAQAGARQERGRFPLVILAQGNGNSLYHQAVLGELLASHGYLVTSSPSQTRISGPITKKEDILPSVREQARDMIFTAGVARQWLTANAHFMSVVGYSFGTRSALLFLKRYPHTKAFVSLDGGIANAKGKDWIQGEESFDPAAVKTPILHLYQGGDEIVVPDFELLGSLENAERHLIKIDGLEHFHFSSLGLAAGIIPGFNAADAPAGEIRQKVEAWHRYALTFLDLRVKDGPEFPFPEAAIEEEFLDWRQMK